MGVRSTIAAWLLISRLFPIYSHARIVLALRAGPEKLLRRTRFPLCRSWKALGANYNTKARD
jgi:hypothetical protein